MTQPIVLVEWSEYNSCTPLAFLFATIEDLQYWLIRFIHEVWQKSVLEYPPNTLHHIISGIMSHTRRNRRKQDVDFVYDAGFSEFAFQRGDETSAISWLRL